MYTRCAHCDTVFRVTPQQLQLSSGQVRCGRCNQVFDAFSSLSSQLPGSASAPPPPPLTSVAMPQAPERPAPMERAAEQGTALDEQSEPAPDPGREAGVRAASAEPSPPQLYDSLTLPETLFESEPGGSADKRPWVIAHALLLVAAIGQAAWFFPTELAARWPGLRPPLTLYCGVLACDVGLPRLPEQLFIEASDLQIVDPARPAEVLLTASVRNRAPVAQDFPLLELTLTDAANQTAARKVFRPADYLEAVDARGIGAGEEISIRLYLDTGRIQATGYRLYLFFA